MAQSNVDSNVNSGQFYPLYAVDFGPKRVMRPETEKFVLGRAENSDFVITSPRVSEKHCEISCSGDSWFLQNLSPDGTSLVGKCVALDDTVQIADGSILKLGSVYVQCKSNIESSQPPIRVLKFNVLIGEHCYLAAVPDDQSENEAENSTGNNSVTDAENATENNTEQGPESNNDDNIEVNAEGNIEDGTEDSTQENADDNGEENVEDSSVQNAEDNPEESTGQQAEDGTEENAERNAENEPVQAIDNPSSESSTECTEVEVPESDPPDPGEMAGEISGIIIDMAIENQHVVEELKQTKEALRKALLERNEMEGITADLQEQLNIYHEEMGNGGWMGEVLEAELQCSICNELMLDAVTLGCSHSYCDICLMEWKRTDNICPLCRKNITVECKTRIIDNLIDRIICHLSDDTQKRRKELIETRRGGGH